MAVPLLSKDSSSHKKGSDRVPLLFLCSSDECTLVLGLLTSLLVRHSPSTEVILLVPDEAHILSPLPHPLYR